MELNPAQTTKKIKQCYTQICLKQFEQLQQDYNFISPDEVKYTDFIMDRNAVILLKNKKEINIFNYNKYIYSKKK